MGKVLVKLKGNLPYHTSFLFDRKEVLQTVYEVSESFLNVVEKKLHVSNPNVIEGLTLLHPNCDYRVTDKGFLQYLKRETTENIYLLLVSN